MKKCGDGFGGELCAVKACGREPTEGFGERFRRDGAGFGRRAAAECFRQEGGAGNGSGAAAAEKTSLGDAAVRNSRRKPEDVATNGIAELHHYRGIG